ncbi:MAG: phosphoglucosamine mutase [Oscillatoriales cyanobacterium SM2_1_8]|nr:phosphoglucosamine mutase [Oscillatoriales cyanobacterium SM2_1_8]
MQWFGTDGIRGRVGDRLTAELALRVGRAAGTVWREAGGTAVAIGADSRLSSPMLVAALTAGLTAAGLEVWDLGLCPTPAVAWLVSQQPVLVGGIMVSASHNPPEDNGIKLFGANGRKLDDRRQQEIEARIEHDPRWMAGAWGHRCDRQNLLELYEEAIRQTVNGDLRGQNIVLDVAWGAAVATAPAVFRALGANVTVLHGTPDGERINVNCGSTHLEALRAGVLATGADLGFAFDGDADRVLAVDGTGGEVNGDGLLYLWGRELLRAHRLPQQTLVTTVMANLGLERAWQALGGRLTRTAVGDRHVQAEMLRSGAMLGGEQSGHLLCHHYSPSGDGLLTAVHIAALVRDGGPLARLRQESFEPYPQRLRNVRVEDRERRLHWEACPPLAQAVAGAIADLGTRGRVLVRPSGTEPLLRIMVEAETEALATYWSDRLVEAAQVLPAPALA